MSSDAKRTADAAINKTRDAVKSGADSVKSGANTAANKAKKTYVSKFIDATTSASPVVF